MANTILSPANGDLILPISPTNGGTGVTNPTTHGVLIAEGSSPMHTVVLGAGQILIGATASDPVGATLTQGTNISISSASGSITINATGAASFTWTEVTGTSQSMAVNNGYIANNAGLVTLTLPSTATQGSIISVQGKGTGGWAIAQNVGQTIHFGNVATTTGVGGSLSSTNQWDSLTILCVTANTTWALLGAPQGNITYV